MDKERIIIDQEPEKTKEDKLKKKMELVKKIAIKSTWNQLEQPDTYKWAAGIGLYQGLKYGGSVTRGLKGSFATVVVMTGANIINNLVKHKDDIKNI